jgi:hypothetical protein
MTWHGSPHIRFVSNRKGGAAMSELTPQHVLVDLFGELLAQNPEELAANVIQRLIDAGFEIRPAERCRS